MGLEAVLPGPQNALYVMLCYMLCYRSYNEYEGEQTRSTSGRAEAQHLEVMYRLAVGRGHVSAFFLRFCPLAYQHDL